MTAPVVEIRGLDWSFGAGPGAFRLSVDALTLNEAQTAACVGPSGSGKSTLVNLMAGVLVSRPGSVRLLGEDLATIGEPERRRLRLERIGMVFQEFELLEYLSALDNMLLTQTLLHGRPPRAAREKAAVLAERAGIAGLLRRKPRRLSQGERQRVAICRALVGPVRLLLCDEPTGNLDPVTTGAMLDLMLGIAAEQGAAVVMVTHNLGLIGRFGSVIDMSRLNGAGPGEGGS